MKTLLLSACTAVLIGTASMPAAAGDDVLWRDDSGNIVVRIGEDRYRPYGDPYAQPWPGQQPDYDTYGHNDPYGDDEDQDYNHRWRRHDNGWNYGWGGNGGNNGWNNGWGNNGYYGNVIPPRAIVRWLARCDYTYITQPVLAGRFYQVKAIAPDGHKVKLYIDAYNGRIVKTKYKS